MPAYTTTSCRRCANAIEFVDGIKNPYWRHIEAKNFQHGAEPRPMTHKELNRAENILEQFTLVVTKAKLPKGDTRDTVAEYLNQITEEMRKLTNSVEQPFEDSV